MMLTLSGCVLVDNKLILAQLLTCVCVLCVCVVCVCVCACGLKLLLALSWVLGRIIMNELSVVCERELICCQRGRDYITNESTEVQTLGIYIFLHVYLSLYVRIYGSIREV